MKRITKLKYPEKTSINLAMREEEKGNTKLILIAFGAFMVALLIFVKIAVINPVGKAMAAEAQYNAMQTRMSDMMESLKEYQEVSNEYNQYSNTYMTPEERAITDRVDALNLVETCVMNKSDVQSIEISGSTMTLVLSQTNLNTVSLIVSSLQDDPRTSYVTVSNATAGEENTQLVTPSIVVTLKGPSDVTTSEDTNATSNVGGNPS